MTTTYEKFAKSSDENRRLLLQEKFILQVTEEICKAMEASGINRSGLANRMGKTKGHISRLLSGDRNLTLRSVADLVDSLGQTIYFTVQPKALKRRLSEPKRIAVTQWSRRATSVPVRTKLQPTTWPSGSLEITAAA